MQDELVKAILKKYLGVPFKHGGRDMTGLDCWGLVLRVYADLGRKLWDINELYEEGWKWKDKSLFIENYHRQWERVEKPGVFDGVLFRNPSEVVNHVGIVIDAYSFIHAARGTGVVRAKLSDSIFSQRLEGFYRLKENANDTN